jgi:hypothetical protein
MTRIFAVALFAVMVCGGVSADGLKTQNVIFVMTDGLRWQEVFHGADAALINKENGVNDEAAFRKNFWRDDQSARREAAMPFLWDVVAKNGQIFGNRDLGSSARVTNPYWFSYPGYSETFCGFVDLAMNSNNLVENPNETVFEWLSKKPAYKNKVAAFGAWEAITYIINRDRAGFPVYSGLAPVTNGKISPKQDLLNHLKAETTGFTEEESPDSITFYSALEYLKQNKPRVFYISLGWTDETAHAGRYDEYIKAAHLADNYLRILWETVQSMPQYKGKTTLIFTCDHGRGAEGADWRSHGSGIPGSNQNWMAFMGPDTPALGERKNADEVSANRIAATLAALLGEDYNAAVPKAGSPIKDVLPSR